jgi:acyl carrier protein
MSKDILIGAYKILRKMGAEQNEIKLETNFYSDLFFDETDRTCLLFFIESRFNIDVTDQEAANMQTVNDMLKIVSSHKAALLN